MLYLTLHRRTTDLREHTRRMSSIQGHVLFFLQKSMRILSDNPQWCQWQRKEKTPDFVREQFKTMSELNELFEDLMEHGDNYESDYSSRGNFIRYSGDLLKKYSELLQKLFELKMDPETLGYLLEDLEIDIRVLNRHMNELQLTLN